MRKNLIKIAYVLLFIPLHIVAQESDASLTIESFAAKLKQTKNAQIIDVRSIEEFNENHLPGAISVPVADTVAFRNGVAKLDKEKPVFVYSINNGRSGVVSKNLKTKGFKEVYQLPGGIAHWIGAGYPTVAVQKSQLSKDDLDKTLAENGLVLVSVGSRYCGSCKKLAPVVQEIDQQYKDVLKTLKVELYQNNEIAGALHIESVPTLILYRGEQEVWRKAGVATKSEIEAAIYESSKDL